MRPPSRRVLPGVCREGCRERPAYLGIGDTTTRRVRGRVTQCPVLEPVGLSGNLGVGAHWVTSVSQLLADFVGTGLREGRRKVWR